METIFWPLASPSVGPPVLLAKRPAEEEAALQIILKRYSQPEKGKPRRRRKRKEKPLVKRRRIRLPQDQMTPKQIARQKLSRRKIKCRKYGISVEQFEAMLQEQGGKCAICGRHQDDLKGSLHIDHNHTTGKVRGLLCSKCNPAIGLLLDSPQIAIAAAGYLTNSHHARSRGAPAHSLAPPSS